jgi:hypothetical protein
MRAPPPAIALLVNQAALPAGAHVIDVPDADLVEVALEVLHVGPPTVVEGDLEHAVGAHGGFAHPPRLVGGDGERLLAEDVLSGLEGGNRDGAVEGVGRGDAHDVELVEGDEFLPVVEQVRDAEALPELDEALGFLPREGHDLHPGDAQEGLRVRRSGVSESDDADLERAFLRRAGGGSLGCDLRHGSPRR